MRLVSRIATTAVALAVAAWLLAGIRFSGPRHGTAEVEHKLVPLLVVAVILALVSSLVKPVLTFFSIPLIIVTLGLFLLVINAAMLGLTSVIARALGVGFHVDGFLAALVGSVIITLTTWVVDGLVGDD